MAVGRCQVSGSELQSLCKALAVAVSFLTLLPVPTGEVSARTITRSGIFFPVAGWLIGGLLAGLSWLMLLVGFPPLAAAVLLVGCEAWLTRGLHLDGVADLFDGLGGSFDRQKRLEIMKDSATGAFGVVGLVVTLMLKTAGLSALLTLLWTEEGSGRIFFFVMLAFIPAASRWAITTLAWKSIYPRQSGTGHVFVGQLTMSHLVGGFFFLLPVFLLLRLSFAAALPIVLTCLILALLPSFWLRYQAHKSFGGVTGDVLGASCEFGEAFGWLAVSLAGFPVLV